MKLLLLFITAISMLTSFSFSQVKKITTVSGTKDTVIVTNCIYLGTQGSGADMDPLGGVLVFSTDDSQDGTGYIVKVCGGTHYYKSNPDTMIFTSVGSALYLFVPQEGSYSNNMNGAYDVSVNGTHYVINSSNVLFMDALLTSVKNPNTGNPFQFNLSQNYPNPFNPSTKISYQLPVKSLVTLRVYDIIGREVATLVNEQQNPGLYDVTFDGSWLASGVYFYRIEAGTFIQTKKFVLLK